MFAKFGTPEEEEEVPPGVLRNFWCHVISDKRNL